MSLPVQATSNNDDFTVLPKNTTTLKFETAKKDLDGNGFPDTYRVTVTPLNSISGTVVMAPGSSITNAIGTSIVLSGTNFTSRTFKVVDAAGNFSFTGVPYGTYTLKPTLSGVVFNPILPPNVGVSVTVGATPVPKTNFIGYQSPSIRGRITTGAGGSGTGKAGVTITRSDGKTATTDANGYYGFSKVLKSTTSYKLTPGIVTSPASKLVLIDADTDNGIANFTGPVYTVSGTVTLSTVATAALTSIAVARDGALADASTPLSVKCVPNAAGAVGTYTITGVPAGTYKITPILNGVIFNPANYQNLTVSANVPKINFVALQTTYVTSRVVNANGLGLSGATVKRTGGPMGEASVTTDSSGYFGFSKLLTGTYTFTVSKPNYVFAPRNISVAAGTNKKVLDFQANP